MIDVPTDPTSVGGAPDDARAGAALTEPDTMRQFTEWMCAQRWYAGKGRAPSLRFIGSYGLADPSGSAAIRVHLVLDEAETPKLYQVPLTVRSGPVGELSEALAAMSGGDDPLYFYDGPRDPAFAHALLRLILDEGVGLGDGASSQTAEAPVLVQGHTSFPGSLAQIVSSRVLGGEQSNTSIVYDMKDAEGEPTAPVICKLFRALHHGDNPDVVLLEALGAAESRVVPRSIGHVTGEWQDAGRDDGRARGHLAFAQEFFPEAEDAWRLTLRAAEEGRDFTTAARALGEATAEVHETLAAALGTSECSAADIDSVVASMLRRLDIAINEVPELARWREAIGIVYARAVVAPWPRLQRIHGDLHLGQVLAVAGRGWVLLDFEGEPLRPMIERNRPDVPLRDVAGMLRSFDYVAGAFALANLGRSATDWALACRRAFVGGYSERTGHDLRANRLLLDAFEIDKAIYEAIYEARNRPDWLSIPVAAIGRLAQRSSVG
ncbi:maltokinase N-terminal cap-like domain-containing protein [Parafrigoribacterium soli]|uniref:maltokinase N-terminal cap-like domain-containing protein n=1 Tax=Parafrigoribacterium soli TaxID=3144663 RepID=UPI0032F01FF8